MSDVRIVATMDDADVVRGLRRVQTTGEMSARTLNQSWIMAGRAFGVAGGGVGTLAAMTAVAIRMTRQYQEQYAELLPKVDQLSAASSRLSRNIGGDLARSYAIAGGAAAGFLDYLNRVYERAVQTTVQIGLGLVGDEGDPSGIVRSTIQSLEARADRLRIEARKEELALEQKIREARARGDEDTAAALASQLDLMRRQQAIAQDKGLDDAARAELRGREAAIALLEEQKRTAEAAAKAMKTESESRLAAEKEIEKTQIAIAQSRAALAQSRGDDREAEFFSSQAAFLQARAAAMDVADPIARQELIDQAQAAYEATQARMNMTRQQEQDAAAEAIRLQEEQYRIELLRLQGRQKDADLAATALEFEQRRAEILKNTSLSESERTRALIANEALRGRFAAEASRPEPSSFTQARTLAGGAINAGLAAQVFGVSPAMAFAQATATSTQQTAAGGQRAVVLLEKIAARDGGAVFG